MDLEKVYDGVDRNAVEMMLGQYGVHCRLVDSVKRLRGLSVG